MSTNKVKSARLGSDFAPFQEAIYPGTTQAIALTSGGSAMLSAAFGSNSRLIKVVGKVACFVAIGASPAATNSTSTYVPANNPQYFVVDGSDKISIKDDAASGNVYVTEAVMV